MRRPLRRRPTGAALLFPLAAAAVLAAGAWLDATQREPFAPVWIERQMVHIGDDPSPRFTQAEPEGTSITRTFLLARIPERPLLVLDGVPWLLPEARTVPDRGVQHVATTLYTREDLVGRQVLAVLNFPPKRIGPFQSEVLVTGLAREDGAIVLVGPDQPVPDGVRLA